MDIKKIEDKVNNIQVYFQVYKDMFKEYGESQITFIHEKDLAVTLIEALQALGYMKLDEDELAYAIQKVNNA